MRSHVYLSFDLVSARKVLRLLLNKCNSGRFASHNNEKGVGLFLQSVCSYISTRARYDDMRDCMRKRRARGKAPGAVSP